jgi:flagellar basal body-associated protein FliL
MNTFTQSEWKRSEAVAQRVVVAVLGLAILVGAVSFGCKSSSSALKGSGKNPHGAVKTVLHLEPFVVNLADPEENHFLRVGIDLGLDAALSGKEGKGGEGEVPISRVRDCVLEVLSSWHSDALLAPEGKEKLKDELVRALRARAPELEVREIYFTDFLVQR